MLWLNFTTGILGLSQRLHYATPQRIVSRAEIPSQIVTPDMDEFINQIILDWVMPGGVGLSVVHQDSSSGEWIDEYKGYGVATQDEMPVTQDTLFAIGSNSKLFDIVATGLLVANGSLSWNTKIASIFPQWAELPEETVAKYATIVDLMSHRTGFPRHDLSYSFDDDMTSIFKRLKHLKMSTEFRWTFQYNNMMYAVLSFLPTMVLPSKPSFGDFVQTHIFDRLGMASTTFSYQTAKAKGTLADGFSKSNFDPAQDPLGANGTVRVYPFWNQVENTNSGISGPGGIISSARDMGTWMKMLLSNGYHPITNELVIPPEALEEISQGISVSSPIAPFPEMAPSVYGGGQMRSSYRGHEYLTHDGGVTGFRSSVYRIPSLKLGITVLTNNDLTGQIVSSIITYALIDKVIGLEPIDWNARYKALLGLKSAQQNPQNPRPSNATFFSGSSFGSLAGKYRNGGYGNFELCLIPQDDDSANAPSRSSSGCRELVREMNTTLPGVWESARGVPTFIAKYDSVWITHFQLSHHDQGLFNVTPLFSVPIVNATNSSDEQYWLAPSAISVNGEFVIEHGKVRGFGLDGVWGAGLNIPSPVGDTVKEKSEVWFDKV